MTNSRRTSRGPGIIDARARYRAAARRLRNTSPEQFGLSDREKEKENVICQSCLYILRVHPTPYRWIKYYFARFVAVCSVYSHIGI